MKSKLIAFTLIYGFTTQVFAQHLDKTRTESISTGSNDNSLQESSPALIDDSTTANFGSLRHTVRTAEQEQACEKALSSVKTKYTVGAIALAMLGGASAAYGSQRTVTSNYNYHSNTGYSSSGTISTTYDDPIARERAVQSTAITVATLMQGMYPDMWKLVAWIQLLALLTG